MSPERGMLLLHQHNILNQMRYELWAVASVKQHKSGAATATLIRHDSNIRIEAIVRFPASGIGPPFIEFGLSENDLRHVWNTLTASEPGEKRQAEQ